MARTTLPPIPVPRARPAGRATRVESAAVLRLVAACAEVGTAADPILAAWAEDARAAQARRLRALAAAVRQTGSVAAALETVPGAVRDEELVAIRCGEIMGLVPQLAAVRLARAEADAREPAGIRWALIFCATLAAAALPVSMFLVIKIAPQFDRILADSGLPRPWVMQAWLNACAVLARFLAPTAAVLVVGLVVILAPPLWRRVRGICGRSLRRPFSPQAAPDAEGLRGCHAPHPQAGDLMERLLGRGRRIAAAIDMLGVAARANIPPEVAAPLLAGCQTDGGVARLLDRVPGDGTNGSRLAAAGLVGADDARRIDAAGPAGLADALAEVARGRRERGRRRTAACKAVLVPAAAVLFGAFVLLQALAVFAPLIDLIHSLAEEIP